MKKLILLLSLFQGTPMEPHLTESDMIEILDKYDIIHTWTSPFRVNDTTSYLTYGSVNYESKNIVLNQAVGNREQRYITIIHEMLHVKYRMEGIPKTEEEVKLDAQIEYTRIFR